MSKVLGYPTRTAAAIALQAKGRSNRQIADVLNLSVSTVSALLASGHRAKRRGGTGAPASAGAGRGRGRLGLTIAQIEDAVMDLYDAGIPRADIAARMDISVGTVNSIIAYLNDGTASDMAAGRAAITAATASLLDAIRRHHPDRCGA